MLEPMPNDGGDRETVEWRRTMVAQMSDLSRSQQQTAVVLERLSGRMDGIDQRLRQQEEDRRTEAQDRRGAPERQALMSATVAQWAIAAIAVAALMLSLVGHVYLR